MSEASLEAVNKKDLMSSAGEKRGEITHTAGGNIQAGNGRISRGLAGCVHSEEVQVGSEEVAWTWSHDLQHCLLVTFEEKDTACLCLRNHFKLEISVCS